MGKRFIFILVLAFLISLNFVIAEDNNSNNQTSNACTESWSCTEWSDCVNNTKTKTCTDLNNCNTTNNKPIQFQECTDNINDIEKIKCESFGGTWQTFSNGCADTCAFAKNPNLLCTQVFTESCNCGPDKCWDGKKCRVNVKKENEEKPQIIKKCELRKKIKDYYINKECPEECTCTGSVIKCELASGRIMSVYAGKSGNVIIQIKGVNMSTNVTLYKNENGTLEGIFRGNKTRIIKVLPDEVKEKIKERIKAKLENEEISLDDDGFYKIKAHKKARFLLIIPVRENIEGQADSETGNIIIIKKGSWCGFLARDVKE